MTFSPPRQRRTGPDVSVVVPSYLGARTIGATLDSLVEQTLGRERFEVVVVLNGPACGTEEVLAVKALATPDLQLRVVTLETAGASRARNVGAQVARGTFVTYVDDDDAVTPRFLERLLAAAEPGVVPTAFIADVVEDGRLPDISNPPSNYVNDLLVRYAGTRVGAEQAETALSLNAGKLIPRELALSFPYEEHLRSGEDSLFWTRLFAETNFVLHVAAVEDQAVYLRTVRSKSLSRQPSSFDFNVTQRLDCIEALTSIASDDLSVRRVVSGKVRAQAGSIRRWIDEHPDSTHEILAEIDRRGIRPFPYDVLNKGKARDLALLYCFAPFSDTSALVASRRILERGVVVDVISNDLSTVREIDSWTSEIAAPFIDRRKQLSVGQAFSNWGIIEDFVARSMRTVAAWEAGKGAYRSVYSRSMWPASHFAAAAYKLANPSAAWIAEFSDPMLKDILGEQRSEQAVSSRLLESYREGIEAAGLPAPNTLLSWEWVEAVAYALADEIVFTNPNQRDYMLGYCYSPRLARRARERSVVRPHPTLPAKYYSLEQSDYPVDSSLVNIAYFGVFYATRGLEEVTAGLLLLTEEERQRLRLHLFTNRPDESRSQIEDLGLENTVLVNGYRPYLEFLNLTMKFDVLLVQDARTAGDHPLNPYLPSKISDYVGSGTAVWSIVEEGSAMSSIRTAFTSPLGNAEAASEILREIRRVFADRKQPPGRG